MKIKNWLLNLKYVLGVGLFIGAAFIFKFIDHFGTVQCCSSPTGNHNTTKKGYLRITEYVKSIYSV